jgi:dihydroorotate dehydrogenase electron transfer subunit
MSNPLHAAHYADAAAVQTVRVLENVRLARDTYRVRLEWPALAEKIVPGQFIMVRLANGDDPLLGRPLALYDTALDSAGQPFAIDVVYLVVGKMTARLAQIAAGATLSVWGPLGNGFAAGNAGHLIMVAGGIGQTPFMALGREALGGRTYGKPPREITPARRVTFCYGARNKDYLASVEDFQSLGLDLRVSTDDGSAGHHGFVTELLQQTLAETDRRDCRIVCCGPERMMESVAHIATRENVPCEVSLETPMACGIGICFSCVTKVLQPDGSWDYKRTCVEGPIFDAKKLVWQ